jgi:hypothetical protein
MTTGVHQSEKKTKSKEKKKKGRALVQPCWLPGAAHASAICGRLGRFRPSSVRRPFFFSFFFFFLTVLKTVLVLGLQVANKNS